MTSYRISRWSTKAGGSERLMDALASFQQTMLRCENDVSEGDAEAAVEEERRSEAEHTNIELLTLCPPPTISVLSSAFPGIFWFQERQKDKASKKDILFSLPCTLLLFKYFISSFIVVFLAMV